MILDGLREFTGTDRRFQYKGQIGGVTIIDDYAHHPTEIEATLHAAQLTTHTKRSGVYSSHILIHVPRALLPEFAHALSLADHVVLADIYAARETDNLGISSRNIQELIQKEGTPCLTISPTFDEIENFLLENCTQGDLLITMGAGDVVNIGAEQLTLASKLSTLSTCLYTFFLVYGMWIFYAMILYIIRHFTITEFAFSLENSRFFEIT